MIINDTNLHQIIYEVNKNAIVNIMFTIHRSNSMIPLEFSRNLRHENSESNFFARKYSFLFYFGRNAWYTSVTSHLTCGASKMNLIFDGLN